jgi:hypothetical protein
VSDQDRDFLHFIERHDLKPGAIVQVEERDQAADSVRLRGAREFTIGARAASKVLVQVAVALLIILGLPHHTTAQPAASSASRPFEITDNSFLVEEAFNQEAGIFQNIFGMLRTDRTWWPAFTQEWPLGSQRHQFSYTVSWFSGRGTSGFGNTLINYRFQASVEGPGRPAFSPRLSLILPTGKLEEELGIDKPGLEINLPFSKQMGDIYWHWNAGLTWLPRVEAKVAEREHESLESPFLAGSAIFRAWPMFHMMLESVLRSTEFTDDSGTSREGAFTLSPGARGGWNIGDHQLVLGFAVPVTWVADETDRTAFFYVSYELPYKR